MSEQLSTTRSGWGELLTVGATAERLGRSEPALRFMIHKGTAPRSALVGGRRMFRASDVEAYIAAAFEGAA
jgi:excisionase family DNA binding protein